jgi:hypothetical protein
LGLLTQSSLGKVKEKKKISGLISLFMKVTIPGTHGNILKLGLAI